MFKAFDDTETAVPASATATRARGRFDGATITLHWLTAALFVPIIATALLLHDSLGFDRATLLDVHRGAGAILWCVMFTRLLWRLSFARLPPFPAAMTAPHRLIVKLSEYALYALVLLQPLTGLLMSLLRGKPFTLIVWQVPPLLPRDLDAFELVHQIHESTGYVVFALIALHASAALLHHYILRDDVLEAMLPLAKRKTSAR